MTTPAQPDPAAELRAAADRISRAAAAARENMRTNTFWHCYPPETAWRDGLLNGFGGAGAEYAALIDPGVGELLADWLDATADYCTVSITHPTHAVRALAVARALLGGES